MIIKKTKPLLILFHLETTESILDLPVCLLCSRELQNFIVKNSSDNIKLVINFKKLSLSEKDIFKELQELFRIILHIFSTYMTMYSISLIKRCNISFH